MMKNAAIFLTSRVFAQIGFQAVIRCRQCTFNRRMQGMLMVPRCICMSDVYTLDVLLLGDVMSGRPRIGCVSLQRDTGWRCVA